MQPSVREYLTKFADDTTLTALDIGGRDVNGHCRDLWPNATWTVLDLDPTPGVDVVADARTWEPDQPYDLALCTDTLEHVDNWPAVIATAARALAPGGCLIVTCPGPGFPAHSGIDGTWGLHPGEHYANIHVDDLTAVMRANGLAIVHAEEVHWPAAGDFGPWCDSHAAAVKPTATQTRRMAARW